MSQDNRVKLECTVQGCSADPYQTLKNKKTIKERLQLMKFCKKCGKRTMHKETK